MLDEKTKAIADSTIEECCRQGMTYKQVWRLIAELQTRFDNAASEWKKQKEDNPADKSGCAKLPDVLCELQEKFPGVKITDIPAPVSSGMGSRIEMFEFFVIHMYEMAQLFWVTDKKFRVTIECDPETGKVSAKREEI